jgi:hypothetical protein
MFFQSKTEDHSPKQLPEQQKKCIAGAIIEHEIPLPAETVEPEPKAGTEKTGKKEKINLGKYSDRGNSGLQTFSDDLRHGLSGRAW